MTPNRSASLKRLTAALFGGAECAPSHEPSGEAHADVGDASLISLPWAPKDYSDCSLSNASTAASSPLWSRQVSDVEMADAMPVPEAGGPCWRQGTYTPEAEFGVIAISRGGVAHTILTPSVSSDGSEEGGEGTAAGAGLEGRGHPMQVDM